MTNVTRRKHAEDRLAYLATFPEQNPNPILELDLDGKICYTNPTAQRLFPDLREQGASHPYLAGGEMTVRQLSDGGDHTRIRETMVGDRTYFQAFSYVPERNFIRIYGMDITHHAVVEERLRLLSEITAKLLGSDSPQELIHSLCRQVMENLDCCMLFGFLRDEASGRLWLNASAGVPDEIAAEIERRGAATVCGCVAAEGRPSSSRTCSDPPIRGRSWSARSASRHTPAIRCSAGTAGSARFRSARGRRRPSARTSCR